MEVNRIDYLMGCCSIPVSGGFEQANAIMDHLREKHMTPDNLRAVPKIPVPATSTELDGKSLVPSLLKAYLRIGVKICGEPYLDADFRSRRRYDSAAPGRYELPLPQPHSARLKNQTVGLIAPCLSIGH